jgi:predicted peptidase
MGALLSIGLPGFAQSRRETALGATAITQVFGDGIRLAAVAVEYGIPVDGARLSTGAFRVEGRTIVDAFTSTSASPADRAPVGRFVILALSPDDQSAALAQRTGPAQGGPKPAGRPDGPGGPGGPGKAGDTPPHGTVYRTPQASIVQSGAVALADGTRVPSSAAVLTTAKVLNPVVDDFRQLEFRDPKTGRLLRYNLYVPKDYDSARSYPLVLFMHDAGTTSELTRTTLYQGLGAVVWASAQEQARRPCFVLAPQYAEIIADDDSKTSAMLDTTIDLVKTLADQYSIDRGRLYSTGQSGGCMMSIAMGIKYPEFFAAFLLVAGQWSPALVQPLARQKLWIIVSQDDDKAYPGQNAITAVLEKEGAHIARAEWNGTWTPAQFRTAFEQIDSRHAPINYVTFRKGSVIPNGQSTAGASGHMNTWRIAYGIEPVREWLFRQHR